MQEQRVLPFLSLEGRDRVSDEKEHQHRDCSEPVQSNRKPSVAGVRILEPHVPSVPRSVFDRAGAAALAAAAQDESPPRIDYNPRHDRQIPVANLDLTPWSGRRSSPVSEPRPIL